MRCWCGYLSVARCRLFAYDPADATAVPILLNPKAQFFVEAPLIPQPPGHLGVSVILESWSFGDDGNYFWSYFSFSETASLLRIELLVKILCIFWFIASFYIMYASTYGWIKMNIFAFTRSFRYGGVIPCSTRNAMMATLKSSRCGRCSQCRVARA